VEAQYGRYACMATAWSWAVVTAVKVVEGDSEWETKKDSHCGVRYDDGRKEKWKPWRNIRNVAADKARVPVKVAPPLVAPPTTAYAGPAYDGPADALYEMCKSHHEPDLNELNDLIYAGIDVRWQVCYYIFQSIFQSTFQSIFQSTFSLYSV